MPKSDGPRGKSGDAPGRSGEGRGQGKGQEKQANAVWEFAGDDAGNAAGQVRIVDKGDRGTVTVERLDDGARFDVKRDQLTKVGGDDDAAGEAPVE